MMDPRKHQRALEKSYSKNLESLVKVDEFLHTYDLPKSNQETKQLKQVYNNQKIEAGIAFKGRGDIFSTGLWMTLWVECLPHSFECQSLDL